MGISNASRWGTKVRPFGTLGPDEQKKIAVRLVGVTARETCSYSSPPKLRHDPEEIRSDVVCHQVSVHGTQARQAVPVSESGETHRRAQ